MNTTETSMTDPLARASETPDVAALLTEFQLAQSNGPGQISDINAAENIRYCRWEGQSADGRRWQKFAPLNTVVRPYDGAPDTRQPLVDTIVGAKVDLDVMAFWNAIIKPQATHINQLTAAQSAELTSLVRWMRDGPLRADLVEGVEYLSQMRNTLKFVVLMPYWRIRYGLRRETMTMQQLISLAQQAPPDSDLARLPLMIADPALEDGAVELTLQAYPYLKEKSARRIVRELRETGQTEFLYREEQEKRPAVRVLVPGVDIFLPEETENVQDGRCAFIRSFYNQATLEAMAVNDGWNQEFIDEAIRTAGNSSTAGDGALTQDRQARRIEIVEALVRSNDDEGVPGIFCTVFSPHVQMATVNADVTKAHYGKHYLLDYAHGKFPLIVVKLEVLGPRPDDSRGVPEILRTQQAEIKTHRDALGVRAQMETNPPRKLIGMGWSKTNESYAPGSDIRNSMAGADVDYLQLRGTPQLSLDLVEQIQIEAADMFGLPNSRTETHPARWQARQFRETMQWLLAWGQAFWQLAVLCYDEYSPDELRQIIGRQPLLTSRDLLQHQINLAFNSRTLDMDWIKEVGAQIVQLMQFDRGGVIDTNKLVSLWLSWIDPTLAQEVSTDKAGAANAIWQRVQADIMAIMDGNKPQLVENDPTAGMKLQFAQQIVAQNPKYAISLMETFPNGMKNPQFNPVLADNFKTYVANLRHNVQEMVTSKIQGRLGVADVGNAPVQQGAQ